MGLSFLNAAFLGGLSLITVPIIIHLLQRRRFQVVRWGAMEFLRLSQKNRSRRLLIEQLLLLLLRCLVIALVVLAISRPVARMGGLPFSGGRGPIHAIIILDNSYSMGYRLPGASAETVWDRARARALDLVERGLRQGDAVSVLLASDPPQAIVRKPSLDLAGVASTLRRGIPVSDGGTSYGKAARLALQIANESPSVNREAYLISDSQATGWEGPNADPSAWEALAKTARIVLMPAREGPAANAAVEWVQPARGLATARASTRIQARIINRGSQPLRALQASLEVDGKPEGQSLRADIPPGEGALVTFSQIFDRSGVRACAVRIGADRLAADDVGYLALRVREGVRVLVLNGSPQPGNPQKDAAFFLQMALAPPPAGPGGEPSALEPRVINGGRFGSETLGDFDVIVLSNVAALEESDRRALAGFVQNGGGALFFPGDQVNAELYNRDLYGALPRLLPARLGGLVSRKTTIDAASLDHPALQRFRGAQDVDISTAEFTRYLNLVAEREDPAVRVMARFADGAPAAVEKSFGLGRVVMLASTANSEWNDLPLKPAFLPLVHQLVAYLASGADASRNGKVGEPLVKALPLSEATRRVTVTDPAGVRSSLRPVVDARGATVTLERPPRAGFYRLEVQSGTRDIFAVNRDASESDLRSLNEAQALKMIPNARASWIGLNEDLVSALNRSRQGIELWRHLLAAALALMLAETMLAQMFGRRS